MIDTVQLKRRVVQFVSFNIGRGNSQVSHSNSPDTYLKFLGQAFDGQIMEVGRC